jgi:hypothetical protein
MSTPIARRGIFLLASTAALIVAVFAAVPAAQASTLYACVKKSGSAHIYTKKPKCKKGESKLSWGTVGPAGSNGTNGANGANGTNGNNGANGATPGLFDFNDGPTAFEAIGGEQTVATLPNVPAGNYLFNAKVAVEGGASALLIHCRLAAEGDFDESLALLPKNGPEGGETQTIPFIVHHQFSKAGTVTLKCNVFGVTGVKWLFAKISGTQMQSVTVTSG